MNSIRNMATTIVLGGAIITSGIGCVRNKEQKLTQPPVVETTKSKNNEQEVTQPTVIDTTEGVKDITDKVDEKTYRLIIRFKDSPTKEQVNKRLKPLFEYFESYSMEGPIGANVYIDFTTKLQGMEVRKLTKLLNEMKEVEHCGFGSNILE